LDEEYLFVGGKAAKWFDRAWDACSKDPEIAGDEVL